MSGSATVPRLRSQSVGTFVLPFVGALLVIAVWGIVSASLASNLPSPLKTWQVSKPYILAPFDKRGELDQGILRFTWYSLQRVAKGYSLAILVGAPLGFLLGVSRLFSKSFDPII